MEYYSAVKNNDIRKFEGKCIKLEKNHSERDNPDPERQTQYGLTHKWILDVKQRIIGLQPTAPEKLGNKKDPKRDTHRLP